MSTDPYIWVAAILTLGVFSFLLRDNPFFCAVEHLLVGLSTGYMFCTYWHNVFVPELVTPLWENGAGSEAHLWAVVGICFLWACKYVESVKDLSRLGKGARATGPPIEMNGSPALYGEPHVFHHLPGVQFHGKILVRVL